MDVRELAAVDMVGGGSPWRRWVIVAEFLIGFVACVAIGVAVLLRAGSWRGVVVGIWFTGVGLNYLPLSLHALSLLRPGALDRALSGVDIRERLRHYTYAQAWALVPLALLAFALRRSPRR